MSDNNPNIDEIRQAAEGGDAKAQFQLAICCIKGMGVPKDFAQGVVWLQKAAEGGNPGAYPFPRPLLNEPDRLEFSFSGLKTAVRYKIAGVGKVDCAAVELSEQTRADLAASFQAAVVDCLVGKAMDALRLTGLDTLCVGGGVAANRYFREKIEKAAKKRKVSLYIAPPKLCTDNAVMGAVAIERYRAGLFESLDLDVYPGLVRN